jgi:hypothetical protein
LDLVMAIAAAVALAAAPVVVVLFAQSGGRLVEMWHFESVK